MAATSFTGSFSGGGRFSSSFVGEKSEGSFVGAPFLDGAGLGGGDDRTDLLEELYPPHPNRWWALVLLSCMSAEQNILWLTYGPITPVAAKYYATSEWWVGNFLAALGGIAYIPCMFFTTWFANRYGLRATLQIGGVLLASGAAARLFATIEWVMVGQTLNAILGPIVMSTPPRLSVEYFPVRERNTATAISYSAQSLGVCLAFLWSPNAVQEEEDMAKFIAVQAAMAAVTGLLVVGSFPQPPEHAPSISAAVARPDYRQSIAVLANRPVFMILGLVWGVTLGMFVGWMALLPQVSIRTLF
jgi:MFS family permease